MTQERVLLDHARVKMELSVMTSERDSLKSVITSLEGTLASANKQLADLRLEHDKTLSSYRVSLCWHRSTTVLSPVL
jgi:hypothetical protein